MAGFDARRVLAAFFEKGWLLYEEKGGCHKPLRDRLTGPVDNLIPGVAYRIIPVTDDPEDTFKVCSAVNHETAKLALFFDNLEGGKAQITGLLIKDGIATFHPFSYLAFPVGELEDVIRRHISTLRYR
jgi:hypothetical protein